MDKLTPKQEVFIAEYLKLKNATQAYIAAGYSPNGADRGAERLLRNVEIAKRVADALTRIAIEAEQTAEIQLNHLVDIRKRCLAGEKFDSKGAIAATQLIGDYLGMWKKTPEERLPPQRDKPSLFEEREIIATILGKRRDYAIQIESPAKVPIQRAPPSSEEVGSGDPVLPDFAGGQIPDPQPSS